MFEKICPGRRNRSQGLESILLHFYFIWLTLWLPLLLANCHEFFWSYCVLLTPISLLLYSVIYKIKITVTKEVKMNVTIGNYANDADVSTSTYLLFIKKNIFAALTFRFFSDWFKCEKKYHLRMTISFMLCR